MKQHMLKAILALTGVAILFAAVQVADGGRRGGG